jgi:alpha-glucosidase
MLDCHKKLAVSTQVDCDDSVLNSYRNFTLWRKQHPELLYGDIEFIDTQEPILAFMRKYQGVEMLVCFNLSGQTQQVQLPSLSSYVPQLGHKLAGANQNNGLLNLQPFGSFFGSRV